MSKSWNEVKKRLEELYKRIPEPLIIELTYYDNSVEVLTLEELLQKDSNNWKWFRIKNGTDIKEANQLLEWIAPSVIE